MNSDILLIKIAQESKNWDLMSQRVEAYLIKEKASKLAQKE
jgi:hypothetical protein